MNYDVAMPYPRSKERISTLLSSTLALPEIAEELEKKAIRHLAMQQETLDHSAAIWESVSSRVESYDLTEQTISTVRQRHETPSAPAYLPWITRMSWMMLTLHPMDSKLMKMTPANPAVGNWRNTGPEMLNGL